MRLALYRQAGETRIGVPRGDEVVALHTAVEWALGRRGERRAAERAAYLAPDSVVDFLAAGPEAASLAAECLAEVEGADAEELRRAGVVAAAADVEWLPTMLGAERFICVGRNYLEHVAEAGSKVPEYPVLFSRYWTSVVGHRQPLIRPAVSSHFDYEGELVAVIGRHCRHVAREEALDVVGGYTILQEGSIRDWQRRAPTQMAGKNFHHSGAMGPCLVTPDELPGPDRLHITTTLNGETMQDSDTSGMLYDVTFLISYISEFMPLAPGDVIATGTPPGVGFTRTPPVFMKAGDTVAVTIGGIGTLENPVVDERAGSEPARPLTATEA